MLGQELRAVRERRGLSIRETARRAGISSEAISDIERGLRYPTLRSLEALAHVLDLCIEIGPDETIVKD